MPDNRAKAEARGPKAGELGDPPNARDARARTRGDVPDDQAINQAMHEAEASFDRLAPEWNRHADQAVAAMEAAMRTPEFKELEAMAEKASGKSVVLSPSGPKLEEMDDEQKTVALIEVIKQSVERLRGRRDVRSRWHLQQSLRILAMVLPPDELKQINTPHATSAGGIGNEATEDPKGPRRS